MRGAALVVVCLLAAGCGAARHAAPEGSTAPRRPAAPPALRVAVIGRMPVSVAGVATAPVDEADLVVVARRVAGLAALVASHPGTHFVLVGRSFRDASAKNVSGILFRDAWSVPAPAGCKEAALDAISRGASVVFAGTGACAEGALAGAAEQNAVGLRLTNFERPAAAVAQTVRDAVQGRHHGGEDVVFGAASGAVGVGRLDPRVSTDTVVRAREVAQELADGLRSAR
jgi:hypothetical protein